MKDTKQDVMFQFNLLVDQLAYAVEKFNGNTCLTKLDIANMRAMSALVEKQNA